MHCQTPEVEPHWLLFMRKRDLNNYDVCMCIYTRKKIRGENTDNSNEISFKKHGKNYSCGYAGLPVWVYTNLLLCLMQKLSCPLSRLRYYFHQPPN